MDHSKKKQVSRNEERDWTSELLCILCIASVMFFMLYRFRNPNTTVIPGPSTTFDDVKGLDEAKAQLRVYYARLLLYKVAGNPEAGEEVKLVASLLQGSIPKRVLLLGPPGTGKTMLAKAIAREAGLPFFSAGGSAFFEEEFLGMGAKKIKHLFEAAKKKTPCIVFIDNIDAIGQGYSPLDPQFKESSLNRLLIEMDGLNEENHIYVIAATNFPELLDKALVAPGRFDHPVIVPLPDVKGRMQILESHLSKVPTADDIDLSAIAKGTLGFSGSELAHLVNMAELRVRKNGGNEVDMVTLEYAKDKLLTRSNRKSANSSTSKKIAAYYSSGRAIVAKHTRGALEAYKKATIVPREMGVRGKLLEDLPQEQKLAMLRVLMGGRAAEELVFKESGVGPSSYSDLQNATSLALSMVNKKYGPVENAAKKHVEKAYHKAKALLEHHIYELRGLACKLLELEALSAIKCGFEDMRFRKKSRK